MAMVTKEQIVVASADSPKGLPTAQEMTEKLALAEAEKASAEARKHAAVEAENKALLDKLPSRREWPMKSG